MIEFQRGEKRKLADLTGSRTVDVTVRHDLAGADVSVFGLSEERKLADDRYFVFYNQLRSPGGEIELITLPTGGTFRVDLNRLPANVRRLVFVATHDDRPFSGLGSLEWTLADPAPRAAVRLRGADFTNERAVMIAEIYLHNGEWRVANVGQGFQGGLQALLEYFGGQVSPPAPATPVSPPPYTPTPVSPPPYNPPPTPASPPPYNPPPGGAGGARPGSARPGAATYSVGQFVANTAEADRPGDVFELETPRMLEVKVRGRVWSKLGAMVAYKGNLSFKREGMLEGGIARALMRAVTQEMSPLAKIEGQGVCYLADQGKEITIIRLQGEAFNVNGPGLLAFEDTVRYDITFHRRVASMLSGGLFSVRLQGNGMIAILSHGHALTLRVTPNEPIYTDPNATIAWSEHLTPQLRVDTSVKALFGRGGGETLQMVFQGDGFVIVQPYEEGVGGAH